MSSVESPNDERIDEALARTKSQTSTMTANSCFQSLEDSLTEPRYSPAEASAGTWTVIQMDWLSPAGAVKGPSHGGSGSGQSPAFPDSSVGTVTRTYSTRQGETSRTELSTPFRLWRGLLSTRMSSLLCFGRKIRMKGSYSLRAQTSRIPVEFFRGGGSSFFTL